MSERSQRIILCVFMLAVTFGFYLECRDPVTWRTYVTAACAVLVAALLVAEVTWPDWDANLWRRLRRNPWRSP